MGAEAMPAANATFPTAPYPFRALLRSPGMWFSVSGQPGQEVQVHRTGDLLGWQDWFGVVLGPGPNELNNPDTASAPHRFYHAVAR